MKLITIPNIITSLRVILLPVIAIAIARNQGLWSCVLVSFFGISDFVDGYIARKFNLDSTLGKLLDPLADKIFLAVVLIYATAFAMNDRSALSPLIASLMLSRELFVTGLRSIAASQGFVFGADPLGKWKATLQFIGLAFFFFSHPTLSWLPTYSIGLGVLYISIVLSYWSMGAYIAKVYQHLSKNRTAP